MHKTAAQKAFNPITSSRFEINGQTFEILRLHRGGGLNIAKIREVVSRVAALEIMSLFEANTLNSVQEASTEVKRLIEPMEWAPLYHPSLEGTSDMVILIRWGDGSLGTCVGLKTPGQASHIVVVKDLSSLLRTHDEKIEHTQPDGPRTRIAAAHRTTIL